MIGLLVLVLLFAVAADFDPDLLVTDFADSLDVRCRLCGFENVYNVTMSDSRTLAAVVYASWLSSTEVVAIGWRTSLSRHSGVESTFRLECWV